jgi:hypothetical protein
MPGGTDDRDPVSSIHKGAEVFQCDHVRMAATDENKMFEHLYHPEIRWNQGFVLLVVGSCWQQVVA